MFSKIFASIFGGKSKERNVISEKIAKENEIEYIPEVATEKYKPDNQFYAKNGRYILLYPANDGKPTCPFEWYGEFDGKAKMIMDNQLAFKNITNLSDILLQIIRLYTRYIDEDVFINSYGFAIRLDGKVEPDYVGEASLVITDDTIKNDKVDHKQAVEAKKYFLNEFLDHFIAWNFGVAVRSNPQLEIELLEFNSLVIQKGLRKYAGTGFEVWSSDDVQHYELKKHMIIKNVFL